LIARESAHRMSLFRSIDLEEAAMQSNMAPWAFVLAVPDIDKSARYFCEVLGFRISWENAADWRLAERDGVRIMLGQCPKDMHPSVLGAHNWFGYLEVDDVDSLYTEFTARGAACTAPKDAHYGMREIVITTTDGHRVVCGQPSKRT
jgi:catechol 2,3-dioxygenase-like lactoylglutathione lyase family enzyme